MLRSLFLYFSSLWQVLVIYVCNLYYRVIFNVDSSVIFLGLIYYYNPKLILIGRDVSINKGVFFNASEQLTIGNNVIISAEVFITTSTLNLDIFPVKKHSHGPVTIQKDVWLCARCIILPNVTVGEGSIVAAGSVVTSNVESFSLYAGVPARKIKTLLR